MSPASETKPSQPNIQDVFLNYVRREKLTVTIRIGGSKRSAFVRCLGCAPFGFVGESSRRQAT